MKNFNPKNDSIQEAYEKMLTEAEKIDWASEVDIAKINLQKGNRFALVFSDKDWVPTLFAKNQSILKSLMKQEFKKRKNMKLMGTQEFIQQYKHYTPIDENLLATIGSIGKMPGQWGKRLGTFGTVLAGAFRDANIEIIGIKPIGKFDNEITVSYKGKEKKIKLTGDSSAKKVVKQITGK